MRPIDFIYRPGDTAESLADRLEKSGALTRFLDAQYDRWEQEEQLEYLGRWSDDGGRLNCDDDNDPEFLARQKDNEKCSA